MSWLIVFKMPSGNEFNDWLMENVSVSGGFFGITINKNLAELHMLTLDIKVCIGAW